MRDTNRPGRVRLTMESSVAASARMLADSVRADAYDAAIRAAVRPGHVVLDIGCGTGLLSLIACQAGARKVYAVETSAVIETAKEIVAANRIDRIEFVDVRSMDLTLPERVDVIVSQPWGVLPLTGDHLSATIDARHRHLAAEGIVLPRRDRIYAALAEAPREYARTTGPWRTHNRGFYLEPARRVMVNSLVRSDMTREQLLSEPQLWATLDYASIDSPHVRNAVTLRPSRHGTVHGLIVWFDATLREGIGYSNAPGDRPNNAHGCGFFPFAEPFEVDADDRIEVELDAELGDAEYIWTWTSSLTKRGAEQTNVLYQSTLFGRPITIDSVRKRAAGFAPVLNVDGEVDAAILRAMTGDSSIEEIVESIMTRFAGRLRSRADTLTRVRSLAERYSL
jgi:protein arginine N-methyltransferase 1